MAITIDDFNKIWASMSPLTPYTFSESNYKQGWNFVGSTPPSRQMWDSWLKMTDEKCQYLYNHEDVPVGHEYFTFNPNIPQGSLPLFGGEYSRETYSALWEWVQEQTGYLKTEAEWQTLATANNGNVPYYSDGDGSTTFRVPALNCWVRSANGTVSEVGSYLQAGLPNITGNFGLRKFESGSTTTFDYSGAFRKGSDVDDPSYSLQRYSATTYNLDNVTFDASRSSSVYGSSATVQPASVVGMWLVKAYGTIADTGVINEQQYIDDRLATKLSLTGGTMLGAIKGSTLTLTAENGGNSASLVLGAGGSAEWNGKEVERVNASGSKYIRFESGLQICWEYLGAINHDTQKDWTFPAPFKDTSYSIFAYCTQYGFGAASTISTEPYSASVGHIKQWNSSSAGMTVGAIAVGWWK